MFQRKVKTRKKCTKNAEENDAENKTLHDFLQTYANFDVLFMSVLK